MQRTNIPVTVLWICSIYLCRWTHTGRYSIKFVSIWPRSVTQLFLKTMVWVQASLGKNFQYVPMFVFPPIILSFPLSYFLCSLIYAHLVLYSPFLFWHHYYYCSWYLSYSTSSHLCHLLCPLFYYCLLDWAGNKRWVPGKEIFHLSVQSVNKSVELTLWSLAFFLSIKQN